MCFSPQCWQTPCTITTTGNTCISFHSFLFLHQPGVAFPSGPFLCHFSKISPLCLVILVVTSDSSTMFLSTLKFMSKPNLECSGIRTGGLWQENRNRVLVKGSWMKEFVRSPRSAFLPPKPWHLHTLKMQPARTKLPYSSILRASTMMKNTFPLFLYYPASDIPLLTTHRHSHYSSVCMI